MKYIAFKKSYVKDIVSLFNEVVKDTIFTSISEEYFNERILASPYFDKDGFILVLDNNNLVAMGFASAPNDTKYGFVNFICVKEEYRKQGIGKQILKNLERYFKDNGKSTIRLYFASPFNLKWEIPGHCGCYHPNAPAIDLDSDYYHFLKKCGYNEDGILDAYYMNIEKYNYPEEVLSIEDKNRLDGYTVEIFDKNKHYGFDRLFLHLDNMGWYNAVRSNLSKDKPDKMLVVQNDGQILGWTGPIRCEESGRGYFAGIGVDPCVQGKGLGKLLFSKLCFYSKENGAKYMSLFTGRENVAKKIYVNAGFSVVRSFAIMRKEIR